MCGTWKEGINKHVCVLGKWFQKCFASVLSDRWHHIASTELLVGGGKGADYGKQLVESNFSLCQ